MHLSLVAIACTSPSGGAELIVVRDSGEVVIHDVSTVHLEAIDLIAGEPLWMFGGGHDEVVLHGIADVRFVDSEKILIAEVGSQEIIGYNVATGEVMRWGGRGYGPLEFRSLTTLEGSTSSEIVAFDQARRRVVKFGYAGELNEEWVLSEPITPGSALRIHQSGSGVVYLSEIQDLPPASVSGVHRGVAPLLRLKPDFDTVTMVTGAATFRSAGAIGAVLFGATSVLTGSSHGIWVGDNARPEVLLWADDSRRSIAVIRWESGDRRVTSSRTRAFWRRVEEEMPEPNPAAVREMRSVLPVADTLPAFSTIIEADDDRLWIGSYVSEEHQMFGDKWPRQEWLVIDRASRSVWKGITPEGFRLAQVAHKNLLGVHTDEFGVQSVRAYSLRPLPFPPIP